MIKKTFLTEIGTEELPAKILWNIAYSFYQNFILELKKNNILYENVKWFATPRRLALKVIKIDVSEKSIIINKKGPSVYESFDINGNPKKAALRWAEDCNIHLDEATTFKNKKGEWLICKIKKEVESVPLLLPKMVQIALKKIPVANKMRWNRSNYTFSRPIRNVVLLLDKIIIPGKIYGITANNFLHHHISLKEKKVKIEDAKQYSNILFKEYKIIANYEKRKQVIIQEINKTANQINGFVKINSILIEEVTSIVESPYILIAHFQKKFLMIPKKILVYTLEYHQKCFPVYDQKKELLPCFIFVANINSQQSKNIISGNEKVIHARLSDTAFFLKNDRKIKLEKYLPLLKTVLFHEKMGTLYEKTLRLKILMTWLSNYTQMNVENDAIRAAILSKCDLITDMVSEFPGLQGTIGMYYSLEEGEKEEIAIAIQEQYLPSFSGDKLPSNLIGSYLSISDRIDTLSGMFIIGKIPTADKDPFALRRLAIGILRIIIEKKIDLDIQDLIHVSVKIYKININSIKIRDQIIDFLIIRLFYWYEEKGYDTKIIKSILSCNLTKPLDIHKRINAITDFKKFNNSQNIILSIKRIANILEKNKEKLFDDININLLIEKKEKTLFKKTIIFFNIAKKCFINCQYKEILIHSCELEHSINDFLNTIKIYHQNDDIRINRLTLLYFIKKIFFKISNFTYLY